MKSAKSNRSVKKTVAPSLLSTGVQTDLIPVEDLPDEFWQGEESPADGAPARYTAERFFRKRPVDYRRSVQLLAAGMGLLKIASLLKVHHLTIAAVRDREGSQIDIDKQSIRRNLRLACMVGAERLPEVMAKLPDGQLPVAQAILLDKLALMDGEPTSRTEHVVREHLTHDAVKASLAEFIEIEASTMGYEAAGAAPKGVAAMLPASVADQVTSPTTAPIAVESDQVAKKAS